ncbi:MAG TPA: hypothetical protein PK413_21990, partial [Thermoanaerobaculia bacterium]|nr:hypothetical protein [Thermoanaerobaculia bacterium]
AQTGTLIFADGFESGDTSAWAQTVQPPTLPVCNCYFSPDCLTGNFCDWGVLTSEDNCFWAIPKPQGGPGSGCTTDFEGPWAAGICDGYCVPSSRGSRYATENREMLLEAISMWGTAILEPSAEGGGPVDPVMATRALALPFVGSHTALELGRHTNEVLTLAASADFYHHFCAYEMNPVATQHEIGIDLSSDPCRLEAGWIALDALSSEIRQPGTAVLVLGQIPQFCPSWQGVAGTRCGVGDAALSCLARRIEDLARYLTTPSEAAWAELFANVGAGER